MIVLSALLFSGVNNCVVAHALNVATQKAEIRKDGCWKSFPANSFVRPYLRKKPFTKGWLNGSMCRP
jgi:hypothetical protein